MIPGFKRSGYFFIAVWLLLTACGNLRSATQKAGSDIKGLKLLDEYDIPFNFRFDSTVVGGLSGIDYNRQKDEYYLVSDDRSAFNDARFYTARIFISNSRIDSVAWQRMTSLLQPDGSHYPSVKTDRLHAPDPEAIRFNPRTGHLVWTSEGERIVNEKDTILGNPSIIEITSEGRYVDSFALPYQLRMSAAAAGPRQNGVIEGLTFSENGKYLFVSVEEPLIPDGPRAGLTAGDYWVRIIKYDVASRQPIRQYAYKLDPVAYPPQPASAFRVNGIPEILYLGNDKLLVVERSFSTGRLASTIKVFVADLSAAADISGIPSLIAQPPNRSVKKKLLLNMDELGIYTDNIEGVTFGPLLANGNRSLLFVSDNNFSIAEKTQILLFEVLP